MGVCVLWVTDENSCLNPSRLDTLLHREAFEVEQDILEEGHELLSKSDNYEDYAARLKDYVEKVTVSKPYYILADLTDDMVDCCKMHQLQITADGMGYFGYHHDESYNAYIQVVSFDGLVESAKERNRAFFDEMGLPSK